MAAIEVDELTKTYSALLAPVAVYNAVAAAVVLAGTAAIGESVPLADLVAVHLLSVPYLLACGAIGLLPSTLLSRGATAERLGGGLVFGLFLVESVTPGTSLEWLGGLSPTRYYDPTAVLVRGEYDPFGAVVLLAGTVLLLALATVAFVRRDL